MSKLKGKKIIITGAASGIGKLMAQYFSDEGADLALLDINEKFLQQTKEELSLFGNKVSAHVCDISDEAQVNATLKEVYQKLKTIDILINNAGIVAGKNFLDLKTADFQKVMNINLMGTIFTTRHVLPKMIAQKSGQIVNIASTAGFVGMPKMSEYCASKFADIGLSDSLRLELKKQGHKNIKITVVCPYVIATGMFDGFKPLFMNPVLKPEKVAKKIVKAVKKKKPYLIIPFYLKYLYLLKIMPVAFSDWLLLLLGSGRAMENFKGRKE